MPAFFALTVPAQVVSRREGFRQQRQEQLDYDFERENGLDAYLEEQEQWERKRLLAIEEHKNAKQEISEIRGHEAFNDYLRQRTDEFENYQETLVHYMAQKRLQAKQAPSDLSEMEEYGLYNQLPRYDYKKRALYGGHPNYKGGASGSKGPFNDFGGGSTSSPNMGSGGFSPSPSQPDNNDFFEPPPPPPPMPAFDENDFPPPPPPPAAFDEGGEGF